MLLSIITVNKNSGLSFHKTKKNLISILHNFKQIEWIIVDSESNDNSGEEILNLKNKFHKKNIRIIIEKDEGIYFAMNKGIQIANSKFILFVNSGDTININVLYKFIALDPNYNQSIIFGYEIEDEKKSFFYDIKNKLNAFEKNLKLVLPSSHNSIIYSLKSIKRNTFDCRYQCGADFNQYYALLRNKHEFIYKTHYKLTNINKNGYISRNKELSFKNYKDIMKKNSYKFGYFYWSIRFQLLRLKKLIFVNK